jgi:hypothetical protein
LDQAGAALTPVGARPAKPSTREHDVMHHRNALLIVAKPSGRASSANHATGTHCISCTPTDDGVASISSTGTTSASAASGFSLRADALASQCTGLLLPSKSGAQAQVWAAGSSTFLCVKPPTQRLTAHSSGGAFGVCNGLFGQDWNVFMAAHRTALGSPRAAGQMFHAQGRLRDPAAPKTTHLSNGLEFTLQL